MSRISSRTVDGSTIEAGTACHRQLLGMSLQSVIEAFDDFGFHGGNGKAAQEAWEAVRIQKQAPEPGVDMAALRQAVLKMTEDLYQVHLKLDPAAADITAAEVKARNADCSAAEYFAADAYRILEQASMLLLGLVLP